MTDKQALLDLAAKVEWLSGPDREVDAEIACYIGKPLGNIGHWLHGADIAYEPTVGGYYVALTPEAGTSERRKSEPFKAQEFTSSLDAAMTLVPEGGHFGLGRDSANPSHGEKSWAWVRCRVGGNWQEFRAAPDAAQPGFVDGGPCLALTAADLRARASMETTNEQ